MTNDRIIVHFDGSYDPHTNVASYGVIVRRGGQTIWQASEKVPNNGKIMSCNVAEYAGLAAVLRPRNALAHSFFPENRRRYAAAKKVLHNNVGLFSLAGVKAFKSDFDLVAGYLMKRIGI